VDWRRWAEVIGATLLLVLATALLFDTWHVAHADDGLLATTARVTTSDSSRTVGTFVTNEHRTVSVELVATQPPPSVGSDVAVVYPEHQPGSARRASPPPWQAFVLALACAAVAVALLARAGRRGRTLEAPLPNHEDRRDGAAPPR
jgi:hypothetical protein